jgi:type VI secretion system protein ImpK
MRLVDFYVPAMLFTRQTARSFEGGDLSAEQVRRHFEQLYSSLTERAYESGFSVESVKEGWFAVCAYVDEVLLTSVWSDRAAWQQASLQRIHFNTTNAGSEFYERLNLLSKHGEDRSVREVFLLCLGLGFKGRYFDPDDRPNLENARGFNLSLLLPGEAQHNLDKSVLFQSAFSEEALGAKQKKRRANLIPYVIAVPVITVLGVFLYYASQIRGLIVELLSLVS